MCQDIVVSHVCEGMPGEKKISFFDERRECVDVDGPVATPGVGFYTTPPEQGRTPPQR